MDAIDWGTILALLPPEYAKWVRFAAEWTFTLSVLALGVKRALGEPRPATDPRWKQVLFMCLHAIDWLAINTTPIRAKDRHREELRKASIPPAGGR